MIQEVQDEGKLDNTLIIFIAGDNGTSAEGTLEGTFNQLTAYNGILTLPEVVQMLHYEDWGSHNTYPHMSVAWSWAFDTPFKWTKQVASHFGGTRQGLAISWPGHINDAGGIRAQFHHIIDVVPTILEAAGIKAPATVDGIPQRPIEGVSMGRRSTRRTRTPRRSATPSISRWSAIAPSITTAGSLRPRRPPRRGSLATGKLPDLETGYKWELYDIEKDYSEVDDLAAKMPDKLKEMQGLFKTEAEKNNVFLSTTAGFPAC